MGPMMGPVMPAVCAVEAASVALEPGLHSDDACLGFPIAHHIEFVVRSSVVACQPGLR